MKKDLSLILNLFYEEIVPEAQNGCISIDDWQYHMQFFVSPFTTPDNSSLILHIHDESEFQKLLSIYVLSTQSYLEAHPKFQTDQFYVLDKFGQVDKRLLYKAIETFLFSNATFDDFENPEVFLSHRIQFYQDSLFPIYSEKATLIGDLGTQISYFQKFQNLQLNIQITEESPINEYPHAFHIWLENGVEIYHLPKIYYGTIGDTCYIGNIQKKKEERTKFHKDLERVFYKVDSSVPMEYKNIEPNILLSLTIFFTLLEQNNFKKVVANGYYPLRHDLKMYKVIKNTLTEEEYLRIYQNIVDRYFEAFVRLHYHFPEFEIVNYPFQLNSVISFQLAQPTVDSNDLLHQLSAHLSKSHKIKRN